MKSLTEQVHEYICKNDTQFSSEELANMVRYFTQEQAKEIEQLKLRELTRKDFLEIWENEVNKFHDVEEYDIANFARAIIKASRGEK